MVHEHRIESWAELITAAEGLDVGRAFDAPYAYRGQSDSEHQLTPSLLRYLKQLNVNVEGALELERLAYLRFVAQAHLYLNPNVYSTLREQMNWWIEMQHYGAPTRLLDWSESIFVAAYFAVVSQQDKDGALWVLNGGKLEDAMEKLHPTVVAPSDASQFDSTFLATNTANRIFIVRRNTQTERMIIQQGLFTVCSNIMGNHGDIIADHLPHKTLGGGVCFVKMIIPARLKLQFLRKLRAMNITAHSLFPGLDGIGRSVAELLLLGDSLVAGID